uniref:Serine protease inhibitor TCI n=1 Tax=Trichuris suis TaxID=68888 RepID=Q9U6V2_9BILA|nr:serine protease inhibitor TCI [Trichuris suis]
MLTDGTLLIHLLAKAEQQCGPDEEFQRRGSAYPLSTGPLFGSCNPEKSDVCTRQVVPGVVCKGHIPPCFDTEWQACWGPSRTFSLLIIFNS